MMLAVTSEVTPSAMYRNPLIKPTHTAHLKLNENPMYVDEDGLRNYEEPMYQMVIRFLDSKNPSSSILMYDYFDSPSIKEAQEFIQDIVSDINSLGIQNVKYSINLAE